MAAAPMDSYSFPMSREKRKLPGIVTYFVVTRYEDTSKLFSSRGFNDMKSAESYKRQEEEKPDPKGEKLVVSIEVLPTRTFPE